MSAYTDRDLHQFNTFKVWRFSFDAVDGIITKVKARLLCEDIPLIEATADLGSPDPALVEKFRNSDPEHGFYLFRHNEDDQHGFLAADRVERKHLAAWAWNILDREKLEAEGLSRWWEIVASRRGEAVDVPPPGYPDEAPDLAAENEALKKRIAELETPPLPYNDEAEEVEPEEAPVIEAEPAPADGIPELFREFMLQDETTERFTLRMKNRLQALKHLQIDGTKPTNARALPDMTEEEIAELADLEARNLKSGNWLG